MREPEFKELKFKEQSGFMIEKIKERPVNKKKLVRRTIITASMAVIFGLIACITFLLLEPVISNLLYPEEEAQIVVFPEDQQEMSPEEMLADNMQQENQQNQMPIQDKEMVEQIVSDVAFSKDFYNEMYSSISEYVDEIKKSMVVVTGVTSNVDWLNNVEKKEHQSCGILVADNGIELLIFADYTPISNAESLKVTFSDGISMEAGLKGIDTTTNLAVLTVDLALLSEKMSIDNLPIAKLGSSNTDSLTGSPVIALGRPMGVNDSIGYGMITALHQQKQIPDTHYELLQTNIRGSQNAGGVLYNLNGEVIGIITNNKSDLEMTDMIVAYGISGLKKRMENISNNKKNACLGISGVNVTVEANEELQVPYGAYVTEVQIDSPAMLAGIQPGDVLVSLNGRTVHTYGEYTQLLPQLDAGKIVEVAVMRLAQDEYKQMKFEIMLGEN